ncbi:SCO5918 family protein [Streptomyces sp. NPDC020898]|uniref:SCO5918 family protein n=1 Tax=Streptomyces sp. NPDC020898 TaxID=3365101 RepID=UPI003798059F
MRCVIARFPFDLIMSEVEHKMDGVAPEPLTSAAVVIGGVDYPVKQVGAVITRLDRRDFTEKEMVAALTRLGFTCRPVAAQAPARPAVIDPWAEMQ